MLSSKTIVITGTHLTPAVELIHQLKQDKVTPWEIHYFGREFTSTVQKIPAVETEIIPSLGVSFHVISCGKFDRRYLPNTIQGIPRTIKGFYDAYRLLRQTKPHLVVSFGGYVSVPVIVAAKLLGIPSITHEQTQTNSLSTLINSIFATKVALSFPNQKQKKIFPVSKVVVTGNLIRREIFTSQSKIFPEIIKSPKLPIIYITTGNQGSQKINSAIIKIAASLSSKFTIIHQTGKQDYDRVRSEINHLPNYYIFDYILPQDIGWIFQHAALIISRSGANSTQEIAIFGHKVILIPLPHTQQHEQELNAHWLKKLQPRRTIILNDLTFTPYKLEKAIKKLTHTRVSPKKRVIPSPNLELLKLIHEIA